MKYEIPKCECEGNLIHVEEVTMDITRRINKNGKLAKKKNLNYWISNGIDFLRCTNCNNSYEVDYDEYDRIIRGDLR